VRVIPQQLRRSLAVRRGAIFKVFSVAGIRHLDYAHPGLQGANAAVNQLTVAMALATSLGL
jgi:hypothetical protein